jgi:hypothetical protein
MRYAELAIVQHRVRGVERGRDVLVATTPAHGRDRRGVARTLGLANASVSRRKGTGPG